MGRLFQVRVSHRMDAPPERVFSAWLEIAQVREWMSMALKSMGLSGRVKRVEIDPKIGGSFLFSDMRNGVEHCHWGTYLEMDHPGRLAFTWNTVGFDESEPCNIFLSVEADGKGSNVCIVNEMDEKWTSAVKQTENGWRCMLVAQNALLKGQREH